MFLILTLFYFNNGLDSRLYGYNKPLPTPVVIWFGKARNYNGAFNKYKLIYVNWPEQGTACRLALPPGQRPSADL